MSVQPNNKITHITRLRPEFSIDAAGNVNWLASLVDHNSDLFYRGKTVTNSEFNELFIKHATQSNYTADSFKEFLGTHLPTILKRQVSSAFNLRDSFIKFITAADWGIKEGDGYYYINIPAAEHGYVPVTQGNILDRVNIEAEFYALDTNNNFYRLDQVEISTDNDVILYTDDATIIGFLVVKTNDKAVAYSGTKIDASMTTGFATVATTGLYTDLIGLDAQGGPNTRLTDLENLTESFINGDTSVAKAEQAEQAIDATNLTGTIRNIPLDNIFEAGSGQVLHATNAIHATDAIQAQYASADTTKGTIEERLISQEERSIVHRVYTITTTLQTSLTYDISTITKPASNVLYMQLQVKGIKYTSPCLFADNAVASGCSFCVSGETIYANINFNTKTVELTREGTTPASLSIAFSIFV